MTEDQAPQSPPGPGEIPPRRTLERAPSARFGSTDRETSDAHDRDGPDRRPGGGSATVLVGGRGALLIAAGGAAVIVVLNVVLTVTAGLVAIGGVTGYLVGGAMRNRVSRIPPAAAGAGALGGPRSRGTALAMALAVGSVLAGAVGTWLVAILAQGGSLGPLDYLVEVMGVLLPIQVLVAAGAAWLGAR